MKRLIYKTKRFLHSLKVRWGLRKSFKIWRDTSYHFQMAAFDMAQTLKGIKPMSRENLERMAEVTCTEKKEGEPDEELRGRIKESIIKRGAAPWKKE